MLVRLRKAYHKAIKAVEQGKASLPFEFELREGGNERLKQPATACFVFKLWDRRTFVLEHVKQNPKLFSQETIRKARIGLGTFAPEKNAYLLEFVRTEALDEMRSTEKLWFLELLEHNVLGDMAIRGHSIERGKTYSKAIKLVYDGC